MNVYPPEVEKTLLDYYIFTGVAILGCPGEEWGEQVVAFVILEDGVEFDTNKIKAFCEEYLAPYKIPKEFIVTKDFPRNVWEKSKKFFAGYVLQIVKYTIIKSC